VKRIQPDLLYFNLPKSGVFVWVVSKLTNIKYVFHSHGVDNEKAIGFIYRTLLRHANLVICVSNDTKRQMKKYVKAASKVVVVYNSVDVKNIRNISTRGNPLSDYGIAQGDFVITYVGNLIKRKGPDILAKAFSRVLVKESHNSKMYLVVVGGDPLGEEGPIISQMRKDLAFTEANNRSIFMGSIPDASQVIANSSVLVLPARMESFGLVLIEAMALGVPVISTNCFSIPEVVENGVTGLLVPPEDEIALSEAIYLIYSSPNFRRSLIQKATEIVESKFDLLNQSRALYQIVFNAI